MNKTMGIRKMGVNDEQFWDVIKIFIGAVVSGLVIIVTGLWRGWFSKIKEGYKKEVQQVKQEAAFDQVDKLTNTLLTNAIKSIENLNSKHDVFLGKVTTLSEEVIAHRKDIEHIKEGLKEIKERRDRDNYNRDRNK